MRGFIRLVETCDECGREFNLLDLADSDEWANGHDCEDEA